MELLLLSIVAAWVVKNGVTDLIYSGASAVCAVRGKPSPTWGRRSRVRLDGAATRYFSRLWADSWEDALARHNERRVARPASTPRPDRPRGAATQFFAGLFQDQRRAMRRSWDGAWVRADEKRRERSSRPRPGQVTVPGTVVPNRDEDGPRPEDEPQDEPQDGPTTVQDEDDRTVPPAEDDDTVPAPTDQQDGDQSVPDNPPDSDPDNQTSSPLATTTQEGPTTMTTTIPTGEVAGLESGITFSETSAQAYTEMVHRIEQTLAALDGFDVGGPARAAATSAMEQSGAAAESMRTFAEELKKHRIIAEAIDTVQGAGTREFYTSGR